MTWDQGVWSAHSARLQHWPVPYVSIACCTSTARSCSNFGSPASRGRRQRGRRDLGGRPSWRERAALKVPTRAPCAAAKLTELAAACSQASSPRCCSVQPGIGATLLQRAARHRRHAAAACVQRRLRCRQAPGGALRKVRRRQRQAGCGRGGPPALVCGHDEEGEPEPSLAVRALNNILSSCRRSLCACPRSGRACAVSAAAAAAAGRRLEAAWRLQLRCGTACTAGPLLACSGAAAGSHSRSRRRSLGRSSSLGSSSSSSTGSSRLPGSASSRSSSLGSSSTAAAGCLRARCRALQGSAGFANCRLQARIQARIHVVVVLAMAGTGGGSG
jgi:hypothetical protein